MENALESVSLIGLIIILIIGLAAFAFYVWSLIWLYKDGEKRGVNGAILAIIGFFFWGVTHLVWLVIRPDVK